MHHPVRKIRRRKKALPTTPLTPEQIEQAKLKRKKAKRRLKKAKRAESREKRSVILAEDNTLSKLLAKKREQKKESTPNPQNHPPVWSGYIPATTSRPKPSKIQSKKELYKILYGEEIADALENIEITIEGNNISIDFEAEVDTND